MLVENKEGRGEEIHLQESARLGNTVAEENDGPQTSEVALSRADGGRDAWLFLAGCSLMISITWGLPFSYGVFEKFYTTHEPFVARPSGTAAIGTSVLGIMYLSSPFVFALFRYRPQLRRIGLLLGTALTIVALVASSFANEIWQLILTQGILYGIGGSVVNTVTISYLDEWFIQRKGLAYGVQEAGAGLGGIVIPLLMNWGMEKYGFRTMLRAWSIAVTILAIPALLVLKPRLQPSHSTQSQKLDLNFFKTSTFWVLQTGNILESFGYFMPTIYLPSYALLFPIPLISGTVTLSLFNFAAVIGSITIGFLVDRFHITTVTLLSSVGAATAVLLLWGLATSFPVLCVFALLYGLCAGGWSSTWVGCVMEVRKKEDRADTGILWGLMAAGRGVGSVISGPVSEKLLDYRSLGEGLQGAYGTKYGVLVVFTGGSALCGGIGWVIRRIALQRNK